MVTWSPTDRLWTSVVRTVTVLPTSERPGAFSVIVPPPDLMRPGAGLVTVNALEVRTESTVNVPL